eukprot:1792766-Pyramimonas_sp.AAC.1
MDANKVRSAMLKLANETEQEKQRQLERDRELAKVTIKMEDVDIIADEFELDKKKAERILRENDGNVQQALKFLIDEWPESTPKVANDDDEYLQPVWPPHTKKKPAAATPPPAKTAEPAKPAATSAPVRPSTAKGKGKAHITQVLSIALHMCVEQLNWYAHARVRCRGVIARVTLFLLTPLSYL